MSKRLSVEYNQLLKLRDELDNILKNNIDNNIDHKGVSNYDNMNKKDTDYELDFIEKKILDFIIDDPGTNKQNIVDNLGISSRLPIFKKIKELVKFGYVIEKINEKDNSSHELYYNDKDSLAILFKELNKFKKSYFLLLYNIKNILLELNKKSKIQLKLIRDGDYTDNKNTSIGELYLLAAYTLLPFKILIAILYLSSFVSFNMKDYNENVILQKFLMFNGFIKDVTLKLHEISLDISEKQSDKNIRFIQDLEREILPTSMETNINFFSRYNLKETAKDLWNSLWIIIFPFISQSDFYTRIRLIIEKNSVNSLVKLLDIKHQYKDIEASYQPHTKIRML